MKHLLILIIAVCSSAYTIGAQTNAPVPPAAGAISGTREQDGLNGPVRRVRVEKASIVTRDGKLVELPRSVTEVSTYDAKGRKADFVAYAVEGATAPGKEEYKYDDKGNIIEMTLRGNDGSVLSKEKYTYEFDEFGNWKKMTTAIALYENGAISYEPTEVTYRTLTYYYGPSMSRPGVPAAASVAAPASTKSSNAESTPVTNNPAPTPSPIVVSAPPLNVAEKPVQTPPASDEANVSKEDVKPPVPSTQPPVTTQPSPAAAEANVTKEPAKLPVIFATEQILRKAAIDLPQPQLSADAELARASGPVQVNLIIDQHGVVTAAQATSGNPMLFDAATSAARKARFLMSAFSDQPTTAYGVLTYNFERPKELTSVPSNASSTSTEAPAKKSAPAETNAPPAPVNETTRTAPDPPPVTNDNPGVTDVKSFAGHFNKGVASLASANYREAVESLKQASTINPSDAVVYLKLGLAYSALGEHKPAITAFKQAIKLNRAFVDADAYYRMGIGYIELSDYSAAINPLKQALYGVKAKLLEERAKSTDGPSETEIQFALGRAYYGAGSYRQAVNAFESAVKLKPNFASAHYGLGLSYLEVGDKRSAEKQEQILRKMKSQLADKLTALLLVAAGQRNKVF